MWVVQWIGVLMEECSSLEGIQQVKHARQPLDRAFLWEEILRAAGNISRVKSCFTCMMKATRATPNPWLGNRSWLCALAKAEPGWPHVEPGGVSSLAACTVCMYSTVHTRDQQSGSSREGCARTRSEGRTRCSS